MKKRRKKRMMSLQIGQGFEERKLREDGGRKRNKRTLTRMISI